MTMQELYDNMKLALNTFGLRFSEMNKVTVIITEESVAFSYAQYTLEVRQ